METTCSKVQAHLNICNEINRLYARNKLLDELGDVLWYVAQTATGLGVTLEYVAQHNVDKLMKRYSDGFDSERSVHRPEYVGGNFNG